MKNVRLPNNTLWPDPSDENYQELEWRLRFAPQGGLDSKDMMIAAWILAAYRTLILDPAFSLNRVREIVSDIRKAIKNKPKEDSNEPVEQPPYEPEDWQ